MRDFFISALKSPGYGFIITYFVDFIKQIGSRKSTAEQSSAELWIKKNLFYVLLIEVYFKNMLVHLVFYL